MVPAANIIVMLGGSIAKWMRLRCSAGRVGIAGKAASGPQPSFIMPPSACFIGTLRTIALSPGAISVKRTPSPPPGRALGAKSCVPMWTNSGW
jgi:hypothetical protein